MLKILSTSVFVEKQAVHARGIKIHSNFYFLRRTAVLILRPAIEFGADGVVVKLFVDPMLNAGLWPKLKPPPEGAFTAGMAGVAAGVDGAADPAPKANTPVLFADAPKPLVLPNWNPPWPVEAAADPNVGAGLGCWPNTGVELGLAPNAGAGEAVAENEGAADPKAGAPCPKMGVCPEPKPEEGAAELKTNGDGLAEGAGAAEAGVEAAAPPNEKPGAFELWPNWKGCAGAGAAAGAVGAAGWVSCCCWPNKNGFVEVASEEELWPNKKVLVGAGAGAREVVVGVPKRLGVELEEVEVLEELAIKLSVGFGADISAILCPKVNDGFGGSAVVSAGLPNVNEGLGRSFGGSCLPKAKPNVCGVDFSASLTALNNSAPEGKEVSFFSSGFPKAKLDDTCVGTVVADSPNFGAAGLDSTTNGLPKTGIVFAAKDVVEVETVSEGAGASSFSTLDWGTENVNNEFELPFSTGLAPNEKVLFSELAA